MSADKWVGSPAVRVSDFAYLVEQSVTDGVDVTQEGLRAHVRPDGGVTLRDYHDEVIVIPKQWLPSVNEFLVRAEQVEL